MAVTTETVLGVFGHVDTTVRALENLRSRGYHDLQVYMPVPIHEIENVMERGRPVSGVRLFTLIGALTGTISGFLLTIWSSHLWKMVVGGKYHWSIPPYVVIAFELTILFGGIATLVGALLLSRLPRLRPSPFFDPRFTNDKFGVAVQCAPERRPSVQEILQGAGAEEIKA